MAFLPIATRELKQAARRPRTFWNRVGATALAVLAAFGALSPTFRGVAPPDQTGWFLFLVLSLTAFVCCLLAGPFLTADCLSEEKREGTLGLLFLTDLRGYDVVFGKLFASSLNAFYAVLGIIPVLAIPLMFGGIMVGEFWRMTLVLLNTFFFSVAIGIFVSALSRHGRKAWVVVVLLLVLFAGAPWTLVNFKSGYVTSPADPIALILSPIYSCWLSFETPYLSAGDRFWASLQVQHVFAWVLLGSASYVLPRSWQEATPRPWQLRWQVLWNEWTLGTFAQREADRRRWLSENPILWLAKRERHRRAFFWAFLGGFATLWGVGYMWLSDLWIRPETTFIIAFTLHLGIKLWLTLETSRRLAEDKRSGALEVLLVTPLSVSEILTGIMTAARRQFLLPLVLVVAVDVMLLMFGLKGPTVTNQTALSVTFLAFIGIFMADAYALVWIGLWRGLAARNSTHAFLWSILQVLTLPWGIFVLIGSVLTLLFFDHAPGVDGWLIVTWFAVAYFTDAIICGRAMFQLTERFRLAAVSSHQPNVSFWPWRKTADSLQK